MRRSCDFGHRNHLSRVLPHTAERLALVRHTTIDESLQARQQIQRRTTFSGRRNARERRLHIAQRFEHSQPGRMGRTAVTIVQYATHFLLRRAVQVKNRFGQIAKEVVFAIPVRHAGKFRGNALEKGILLVRNPKHDVQSQRLRQVLGADKQFPDFGGRARQQRFCEPKVFVVSRLALRHCSSLTISRTGPLSVWMLRVRPQWIMHLSPARWATSLHPNQNHISDPRSIHGVPRHSGLPSVLRERIVRTISDRRQGKNQ